MSKNAEGSGQSSRKGRLISVLAATFFTLLLPVSLALGFLGAESLVDSGAGPLSRLWSVIAVCVAVLLFLTNFAALRFLKRRESKTWFPAARLIVLTLSGFFVLVLAGIAMFREVGSSGTDYTGLGGVGCFIFGIALPTVTCVLLLAGSAFLLAIRRSISIRDEHGPSAFGP
jgi:hypothetical protein